MGAPGGNILPVVNEQDHQHPCGPVGAQAGGVLAALIEPFDIGDQARRIGHALADIYLCRVVVDDLGTKGTEALAHSRSIGDVALVELGAGVEVLAPARDQIIKDGHGMALLQQCVYDVRPNESGPAGDENAHV